MKHPDPRDGIITHLPALRAFALSLTQNTALADDLVQDTVIKAWTNFGKFAEGSNLRAWLFTILRNLYYSHRRKHKYEVADVDGVFAERLIVKPAHDGRLHLNDFLSAFRRISAEQREALLLIGALGFTYEEAAEMCDVPLGTIKSRANRARMLIAEMLGFAGEEMSDLTDASTKAVMDGFSAKPF